ncbi:MULTISPECIES: DUF2085 domain-containing protein [Methanobacterium]|jgi:uncharacterized membrane protein|uniref:DUF2085 domain-containing protein n=1 Tax=Methanobacterium veterum TaxID=408577 RepID=A0A9E4ZW56_9EURY|nr:MULTISPECIES: DUF2085 domain-containing protein [Methanobacterium]MCZ3365148.1 DUF2085 domain-containing protein [Methanobacterium veterum]MCZ3372903.1 DUF2085 domain-containing protein [Methanobacterium veterum]
MDNQNLQANGSCASKPQNKKILQESMDNSDTNLSKVFICHRLPERTFKIRDHYFPVCSRCTGIYIGAFSYYIFVYFVYLQYAIAVTLAMILMVVTTFLDGLTQFFRFRESNNILKFSSGLQVLGLNSGLSL